MGSKQIDVVLCGHFSKLHIKVFRRLFIAIIFIFPFYTSFASNSSDSLDYFIQMPVNTPQDLERLWTFTKPLIRTPGYKTEKTDSLIRKVKTNSIRFNNIQLIIESSLKNTQYPFRNSQFAVANINELNWLMLRYKSFLSWEDYIAINQQLAIVFWSLRSKSQTSKRQAFSYAKKACDMQVKHQGKTSLSSVSILLKVCKDISYDSTLYYMEYYKDVFANNAPGHFDFQRALLERHYKNWEAEVFYMNRYKKQFEEAGKTVDYHEIAVAYRNSGRLDEAEQILLQIRDTTSLNKLSNWLIPNINLGKLHMLKENWKQAEFYLEQAKQLATDISNYHLYETFDLLKELYSNSGQLEKFNETLLAYQDIVVSRENQLLEEISSQDAFHQYLDELSASLEQSRQAEKSTKTFFGIILIGTFFVVGILILGFVEFNRRKAAKLQQQLNHLRLRSIANQFNSHLTFNSLSGIQYLLFEQKYDTALQAIEDFGNYMRQQMRSIRAGVLPLGNEIQLIRRYLAIEQLRFEQPFDVRFSCPAEFDQLPVPTGILQPILENILQHAFPNGTQDAQIKISAHKKNNQLFLAIEDNGIGIPAELLNFKIDSTSLGLRIIHEKIRIYSKLTKKKFAVSILSRHTQPSFAGTRIELIFPMLNNNDIETLTLNF